MSKIYTSITQLIGKTPLLELTNYEKKNELTATLLAKLELFNAAGCVKDRIAKAMIEESENRLKLAIVSGKFGIWDWNLVENTMIWDERMFELYGITKDTFSSNIEAWINGLHPDDKQRAIDDCKDSVETRASEPPCSLRNRRRSAAPRGPRA